MPTLQERRHAELSKKLARAIAHRDDMLHKLIKAEGNLDKLRRQVRRYEKLTASSKPTTMPTPSPTPSPSPTPMPPVEVAPPAGDSLDIPGFLARDPKADAAARDAKAREQIAADIAERKRAKSRGRVERMKAKKSGDAKRMPLTGKAALAAIHGEG